THAIEEIRTRGCRIRAKFLRPCPSRRRRRGRSAGSPPPTGLLDPQSGTRRRSGSPRSPARRPPAGGPRRSPSAACSRGRLGRSPALDERHAAPGNPGIAALGRCHPARAEDAEAVLELARSLQADLVVVGPEAPLVTGVADVLRHAGVPVFGPSAAAARI